MFGVLGCIGVVAGLVVFWYCFGLFWFCWFGRINPGVTSGSSMHYTTYMRELIPR